MHSFITLFTIMKSKNKTKKFVAILLSGALALSLFVLFGATPVKAATVEELTAQINSLLAMIATLQAQLATVSGGSAMSTGTGYTFTRNLKQGDTGADVKELQKALNAQGVTVSQSGAGSPGNETMNFGPATKAAVIRFQDKYAAEILSPVGLSAGTGFVGASTRAKLNSLGGAMAAAPAAPTTPATPAAPTTPTTPAVTVPVGSGLTVTAAAQQPAAQLAPLSAARIPFTKVTLTASADGDVTVNGLVIERTGQSVDAAIDGVILLDESGLQLGIAKTLNSSHQATLTEPFTVKAGQSRTMTIAANRPTSTTAAHAGMVAGLSLVQVNTSATVNGSFPISGTAQTINEGLTIGSVTMNRGSLDPGTTATKEVGVTGYTFSSIRVTAGSAENIRLRSIKWNESGSVSASDLANTKTYVDGTAYDTTQSGDYYTTSFGAGIVIEKGFNKEISIKGDIIGGSSRTTAFDIAKRTDLDVGGELYGYGIVPPQTNSCSGTTGTACFTSAEDPWYDGAVVTVSAGTMNVSTSNAAPAQNIAVNTANQPLGAFTMDVKGESITVARIGFNVALTGQGSGDDVDDITNVTLVDENGSVIAGPVDGSATDDHAQVAGSSNGAFVFTDTVTFPIGVHTYKLLGKIDTSMDNNTTIAASTTPSSDFATVKGTVTNTTITPAPTSALTLSTMTVKAGALTISRISEPPARTIIAGGKGIEFARYSLNASASGEDVRVTTIPLYYDRLGGGGRNDLTNCQIFDAISGTALTTGSNVKNPVSTDTASSTS
ncbi:MAG: peptidoglycan-binding protein, partial [Parcubacteria group bacterium]|nr:peptidoglycan-binding protein [Parcubacteria group bacterium]